MAIDYGNFPSLNPANLGYTSCPAAYTPPWVVFDNVVRVFKGKQAGAIAEIETLWGAEIEAIPDAGCQVGIKPDPVAPMFMVRGKHGASNAGQLLELVYSVTCYCVVPKIEAEAEREQLGLKYADLMERIFWQVNPQLFLWRAQFGGESDGAYLNFLTSIPPVTLRAETFDITGQNSPFERCATAQANLEIRSTVTRR